MVLELRWNNTQFITRLINERKLCQESKEREVSSFKKWKLCIQELKNAKGALRFCTEMYSASSKKRFWNIIDEIRRNNFWLFSRIMIPHNSGVVLRKNKTVMNMVRSLLCSKEVPKRFWPEAANWVDYVLNRSPTWAL